ncbi:MAG: hypothetical protein JWN03_5850 [Nocardia sp.]|uniref:hypothetical protein n=1 Tax=Nocardia sp. TaxID=1821 RepID=UPI002624D9D4|nr:hypothetical protein [Nocardia sp.]MCU1645575.1 hypothetical protein [Nocardia sp.]
MLTLAEADTALARLDADRSDMSANLVELEGHPGVRFLDEVPLSGTSAQRWAAARGRLGVVWSQFTLFEGVVARVHKVRARRLRPGPAELAELTALLCGPSVVLAPQPIPFAERQLTGPAVVGRSLTLVQLVGEMTAGYSEVARMAAAADTVASSFLPGVDRADAGVREIRQIAVRLELAAINHPLLAHIATVEQWLNTERALAMSDPLTVAERHQDPADPVALTREIDELRAKLAELRVRRESVAQRLSTLAEAVEATAALYDTALAAAAITAAKILGATPPLLEPLAPLRDRLALLQTGRASHWTRVNDEVVALTREAERARTAADTARDHAVALLDRRDELRGRLDAYRAKGARLRLSEDATVDQRYRRAHELLHCAPCDLAAATRALTEYQRSIIERTTTA